MKKLILAAAVCACAAFASSVHAQQAEPAPEHSFTGNLTVASDYRFRGISQTFNKPAVQGGFDYAHSSGFYVGNWNSNVSGNQFPDGASIEMDLYGGYKFTPLQDMTADVGVLRYYYPGASIGGRNANATEVYVGAAYKWFSAKYSHGVSDNYFGIADAKGSYYLDLNANFEVADKTVLGFHAGRQKFRHAGDLDYTDFKVGISRDFGFATLGLAVVGSNADEALYTYSNASGTESKDVSKTTAVLSISKTF
ncbi:TorF family putative porin [Noviherbaspirillum massiliense]|uniref:TorF family putative porin n=1 Tax=Noviherbaspirillum massiliense TaxID=1465823 RepID=UPI0002DF4FC2|nr:TorF family putative porin [Noviherbaspirillum massiliense]